MAHPGNTLKVPLSESDFVAGLLKVKPTAKMPKPGAQPMQRKARKVKRKKT